jgi:hypothetical protein
MSRTKLRLPRVPLPRQTGGAHHVKRELSAREELTLRLNEMEQDYELDAEALKDHFEDFGFDTDKEDYYDFLLSQLDAMA